MFAIAAGACLAYAAYKAIWVSSGDAKTDYRQLASDEAVKRNQCFADATSAYQRGEKKLASVLSERGKQHDAKMKEYKKLACDTAFDENNKKYKGDLQVLDLHGLYAKEAVERTEKHLLAAKKAGLKQVIIITGKGNNSVGNIAKIKPAIQQFLKDKQMKATVTNDGGSICVELDVPKSEAGWFDLSSCCVM